MSKLLVTTEDYRDVAEDVVSLLADEGLTTAEIVPILVRAIKDCAAATAYGDQVLDEVIGLLEEE